MEARKLLVGFVLSIAVATPLMLPAAAAPREENVLDYIERMVAESQAAGVTEGIHTTWTDAGPVERVISADEFIAITTHVVGLAGGERLVQEDAPLPGVGIPAIGCGAPNAGDPLNNVCNNTAWPFCDYASIFIVHTGAAGAAIKSNAPLAFWPTPPTPICGGFYGASSSREGSLSNSGVPGVSIFCGAVETWLTGPPYSIPVGATGGYKCASGLGTPVPFTTASVRGNAALFSVSFGFITQDYFLGGGNFVTLN